MKVISLDPGNELTAFTLFDSDTQSFDEHAWKDVRFAKWPNIDVLDLVCTRAKHTDRDTELAIEMIASYGMPVGREVFETCVWIGRFARAWEEYGRVVNFVYRREVKLHLCGSPRAKDGNVRQALIDRWGGKEKAIGKKKTPGPLYGCTADVWAALAVAVTHTDVRKVAP